MPIEPVDADSPRPGGGGAAGSRLAKLPPASDAGHRLPGWLPGSAGFVLGVALQLGEARLATAGQYAAVAALGLALLLVRQALWRRPGGAAQGAVLALLALAVGLALGFASTGGRARGYQADALDAALEGRDVRLTGVVAQMPQRTDTGLRFRFEVEQAQWAPASAARRGAKAAPVAASAAVDSVDRDEADAPDAAAPPAAAPPAAPPRVPSTLSLAWYADDAAAWSRSADDADRPPLQRPVVHAGERWTLNARLRVPHGSRNPSGFDFELWMWEQGLQASGYVRAGPRETPPRLQGRQAWRHPVESAREAVRDAIEARIAPPGNASPAQQRNAGVVTALVTGDQSAIDRQDWELFRATGVAHLMSISGLHITMFAWLAAALVGALWRRSTRLMLRWPAPQAALVGGVALAALYAVFSGWGVPSQRTVCMLALAALLRLSGRRWPWPCNWLLVGAGVVALDPWALTQAGFWLSFVAVGVLFATDSGASSAHSTGAGGRIASKIGLRLLLLLREQLIVTLALAPLTLLLFQQISLVGLAANLLAIPWVTLVVTPLAMLGVLCPPLWDAAAWAVQGLGVLLQALAALPGATYATPAPPLWAGAAGVAGGLLLVMRLPATLRLLGLPLLMPALLWPSHPPPAGEFELLAADIGQGNAVIVRTAGHALLYDTGPRYSAQSDAGQRVLQPLLRAEGVRLDVLLLSHRDTDHTGGAAAVLAAQPQAGLLSSLEPGHPLLALRTTPRRCEAGQQWDWDGVHFELLHPQATDYVAGAKSNALSCTLRVSNGRATALLAGDIERPQELALVARAAPGALRADWLLVPHHGSQTSSSPALLEAVRPRWAMVQAGWANRFGHPAPAVVARLREAGSALVDTPRCGAARWRSEAPQRMDCERQLHRRYWQHEPPPLR